MPAPPHRPPESHSSPVGSPAHSPDGCKVPAHGTGEEQAGRLYGGTPDQAGPMPSARLETIEDEAA
ncbi:hypothetical protein [Streptomyces sp. NPDC004629]|uniref:hypothetical protein n=1 Tax=Streptomyces sp. NPDC004629 TaxID=3364705 RepID=UPI00369F4110